MKFRDIKKFISNSLFKYRNFVFANGGATEGGSGPTEESRLSPAEQEILNILSVKSQRTREEEEIFNLLKAKKENLRSMPSGDPVKRYFAYLFQTKITNKKSLEPNELQFLQNFRTQIELSAASQTEKDNVAILYYNIREKEGSARISKIIAEVRAKVGEAMGLQVVSVKDYLAELKKPERAAQLNQVIPAKKDIDGAWANFDRKVEKFFVSKKSGLFDKSRDFVNFLKRYNADPTSHGVAGVKAFQKALEQFKKDGRITDAEYANITQNEEFRALVRERDRLANIAHLRDAKELRDSIDNFDKLRTAKERAVMASAAVKQKWTEEARAKGIDVDNPQFKVSLQDRDVLQYSDANGLDKGVKLLRQGGLTELNDETFASTETQLQERQEQLQREKEELARQREELSGRLEVKRAQAGLHLSLNYGADKKTLLEQFKEKFTNKPDEYLEKDASADDFTLNKDKFLSEVDEWVKQITNPNLRSWFEQFAMRQAEELADKYENKSLTKTQWAQEYDFYVSSTVNKDLLSPVIDQIKGWAVKNAGLRDSDALGESFKNLFDYTFVAQGGEVIFDQLMEELTSEPNINLYFEKRDSGEYYFNVEAYHNFIDKYINELDDGPIKEFLQSICLHFDYRDTTPYLENSQDLKNYFYSYWSHWSAKRNGLLKGLFRHTDGSEEPGVQGFINQFGQFMQQSVVVDSVDDSKVNFDASRFIQLIDEHNSQLPSFESLKQDQDYIRSQELVGQLDEKRKEESKIELQLKTMRDLRQKFGMTDEERQIDLMKYYQEKLTKVSSILGDGSFDESKEEDLQKLIQLNDLLKEKSKIFAQMGVDIEDDKLDWSNSTVDSVKAKFKTFDEQAKAALKERESVLTNVGSARKARKREEGITNVSFDDEDIKTAPPSINSAKQKEDFLKCGAKVRASFDKVRSAGNSLSFVITNRENFSRTHPQVAEMLNVKGKVYGSEIEQRILSQGSQHEPMGVQMPLNVEGTKHVIYLFDDYQQKLQERGLDLKKLEDKKKADTILSDFLEEELHHIRQDKMRDKFDAYVDLISTHEKTKAKVADFHQKWKDYYSEPNTSLKVAIAEADAANNGKKYSEAYAPVGNLWEEICKIAADSSQMGNFTADFSIFRDSDKAQRELGRRARAAHDNGLYGEDEDAQTPETKQSSGLQKAETPQEKAREVFDKIKIIVSQDDDTDKDYVLNLKALEQDINENNIKHDGIDFNSIREKFETLQKGLLDPNITESTVEELSKLYEKYETNLQKIRTQVDEIKGERPYEMSFWNDIWFNTRLLSLNSCGKIATEAWAHLKEEHDTMESFKAHLVGNEIGGSTVYGSKQKAKNQSDETNKVSEWKKIFDGLNDPVIQEMLMKCKNEFELKAIVEWKAEKIGDLDFGSEILWDAIERSLGKKVYSRKQAEKAYDDRFGPNSAVDNNKKSRNTYNSKANEYKETVRADQNMFDIWYGMVEKVESAKSANQTPPWVDMRQYDGAFRYCIEDGKSTPQKSFYYFFKGYHLGILSDSAATELGQIEFNKFPPIEQVQVVTANHKKHVKFNPPDDIQRVMDSKGYNFYTEVDFIAALKPFNKDGSANNPDYLLFEWWLSGERFSESKMAEDRLDKAIGRYRDPPDPDWGEEILWHLSERSLKNTLNRKEDSSDKIAVAGVSNMYKTLIYYGGMMRDDLLEKTLKKFVNIDRYMFEESYKKEASGEIKVDHGGPVRDTSKPTAPVYSREELRKTSVNPPFLGLGAYRFAIMEAARAYARGGSISEARKELIKYGAALGVLADDDGTESFIEMRLGADFKNTYNNNRRSKVPANADAMKSACTNAIETMPLMHTAPLGQGGPYLKIDGYEERFGKVQ